MLLVREGIITITNYLFAVHKGLEDPASVRHFITMFIFFSLLCVGLVVFILGQGGEERERESTVEQQNNLVSNWDLITWQHSHLHWLSLAKQQNGLFVPEKPSKPPERVVWGLPININPITIFTSKPNKLSFSLFLSTILPSHCSRLLCLLSVFIGG